MSKPRRPRKWGKRPNTIPSTRERTARFSRAGLDHAMPMPGTGAFQRTLDRHGDTWPGTSRVTDPAARRRRNRATMAAQRAESARLLAAGVDLGDHVRRALRGETTGGGD